MKTMYRTEANVAEDCEGYRFNYKPITEYTTKEAAEEATKKVTRAFPMDGTWRIVARTIDEATFTVKDETIAQRTWWDIKNGK